MKTNNPLDRARAAFLKAVGVAEVQNREHASVGWRRSATEVTFTVPGRANFLYVTKGGTIYPALNRAGVPRIAFLPVLVVLENNTMVIVARDNSSAETLVNVPDSPYGVPSHPLGSHSDTDLATPAAGAVARWDATLTQWIDEVLDSDDIAEGASNLYLTQERVEDFVAVQFVGNTGRVQFSYNDSTGALTAILDVSAADRILYSTGADAWAETAITAFGRSLIDDADAAAGRATLEVTQEHIEDYVGGMVAGNTETGVTVTYDDSTGKLNFDAQTAGDLRYVLKTGDTITGILVIEGATGGNLNLHRNDTTVAATNNLGFINFTSNDSNLAANPQTVARIRALAMGTYAAGDVPTALIFEQMLDGTETLVETARIDENGALVIRQILKAVGASGLIFQDDGGNNAIVVLDGGKVSVNNTLTTGAQLEVKGFIRSTSFDGQPSAGEGMELLYNQVQHRAYMQAYDRTNTNYEEFALEGSVCLINPTSGGKAIVGLLSAGASVLGVKAGASNNDAAVGGVLYVSTAVVGNLGAGEDVLGEYVVPADTLNTNGQSLHFTAWGTFTAWTNEAPPNHDLKVRFGTTGTNLMLSISLSGSLGGTWWVEGDIIRSGATSQKSMVKGAAGGSSETRTMVNNLNQTLSGTVSLRITGEGEDGTDNELAIEAFIVEYRDANI